MKGNHLLPMKKLLTSLLWLEVCDTCMSSISTSFFLQVHNTYQGPPGILLSSAPKTAAEVGGACMSPACHPHNRGQEQHTPTVSPDTWWGSTVRQMLGTCCQSDGSTTQPSTAGAALDHRHQLLFWQAPGNGCSLPAEDGNRYLNFITINNSPCHFSF